MVDSITFAVIGVILSAIGITGGFLYNAKAVKQSTLAHYYQIQKDLLKEFHEIEMLDSNEDKSILSMRIYNFAFFLLTLLNKKIIPRDYIYPEYTHIFSKALWIQKNFMKDDLQNIETEIEMLEKFCEGNNINEEKPDFV